MFTSESPPGGCDNESCSPGEAIDGIPEAPKSETVGKLITRASSTRPSHEETGCEEAGAEDERLSPLKGAPVGGSGSPVLGTGEGEECMDGVGSRATVKAGRSVLTICMARAVLGETDGNRSTAMLVVLTARIACSRDEDGSGVTKRLAC